LVTESAQTRDGVRCTVIHVNVVTLIGNLATDVDVKELAEGKRVASFLLAVDRAGKEGGADFVRVSVWDRQADLCRQFLHKGDQAALDGRLRSRSWQAPDGTRRSAVEVVANRVQFLTSRGVDPAGATTPFEEAAVS
jgi:single-strand DNA-binding protein